MCGWWGVDDLAEEGRRLASEREDLIQRGADPAQLLVPLHPADRAPWITNEVAARAVREFGLTGYVLRCSVCKRWEWTGKSGGYLAHGWPTCHGYTMTLVTQRQLDEEGWEPEG